MKIFRLIAFCLVVQSVASLTAIASTPTAVARPENHSLRWKTSVIRIAVSSSLTQPNSNIKTGSDVMGALSRSLDAWSEAAGIEFNLEFSDKQNVSSQGRVGDGVSLVTIAQTPENLMLFARDPYSEAARTRVFYNRRGYITEADIVLNPFQQFSTDGTYGTFDLETTFAHEIGHLLGLKHSSVMGSLMSGIVAKITRPKLFDSEMSLLSESDIAAIRSIYTINQEDCCGSVSGRLLLQSGRPARHTLVWAEDSYTGRIVSQSETTAIGTYLVGGLKTGNYRIFSQRRGDGFQSGIDELGVVSVETDNVILPTQRLDATSSTISLSHVGLEMQLGNTAVELDTDAEYLVSLAGGNLDVNVLNIEFTSPFIKVLPSSIRYDDFGDNVKAMSFVLKIDRETPTGIYSIFVLDLEGRRTALIGAISIRNTLK